MPLIINEVEQTPKTMKAPCKSGNESCVNQQRSSRNSFQDPGTQRSPLEPRITVKIATQISKSYKIVKLSKLSKSLGRRLPNHKVIIRIHTRNVNLKKLCEHAR